MRWPSLAVAGVLVLGGAACGGDGAATDTGRAAIVVTHPVTGAAVRELVGDAADVAVVIPEGVDPHEFRPSARDIERLADADLVVANGLDLEAGLTEVLERVAESGTPVFEATDHIELRHLDDAVDEHHDERGDEHDGDHGGADPHFWVDPIAMRDAMAALARTIEGDLGLSLGERPAMLAASLEELDRRTRAVLHTVPEERRVLVTGHESMGYFAVRYGFEVVGAVIPSTSTEAEPSAAQMADLKALIIEREVSVVFNELGTSPAVAKAVAEEAGARVVELATNTLPDDGSYAGFVDHLAGTIATNLEAG